MKRPKEPQPKSSQVFQLIVAIILGLSLGFFFIAAVMGW